MEAFNLPRKPDQYEKIFVKDTFLDNATCTLFNRTMEQIEIGLNNRQKGDYFVPQVYNIILFMVGNGNIVLGLNRNFIIADTDQYFPVVKFRGERHFPGQNYTGPGTKFSHRRFVGIMPVSLVDAISCDHDADYMRIEDILIKCAKDSSKGREYWLSVAKKLIGVADCKMISRLELMPPEWRPKDGSYEAGLQAITWKFRAEWLGINLGPFDPMKKKFKELIDESISAEDKIDEVIQTQIHRSPPRV